MTNIIKANTAIKLPVILIDDTDFKSPETGVTYNATGMTVRYRSPADETTWSTKTLASEDWNELGHGVYLISFSNSEIGSTTGQFIYYCQATGILPYYGSAYVTGSNLDDLKTEIDANETKIDIIDTVVDAIKAVTDNLPNSGSLTALTTILTHLTDIKGSGWTDENLKTMDEIIDAIKVVADNLPDSGALTTLITHLTDIKGAGWTDENLKVMDALIDAIKAQTDKLEFNAANKILSDVREVNDVVVTNIDEFKADVSNLDVAVSSRAPANEYDTQLDVAVSTRAPSGEYDTEMARIDVVLSTRALESGGNIATILKVEKNRWKIVGNQMIMYEDDGSTPLFTFNLKDAGGNPAETNVKERVPA